MEKPEAAKGNLVNQTALAKTEVNSCHFAVTTSYKAHSELYHFFL